jgi:Bax protein
MPLWLKRILAVVAGGAVLYIAAIPVMRYNLSINTNGLASWQIPSKMTALSRNEQRELLKVVAYPTPLPEAQALPDFAAIADTAQRKMAFFAYLTPFIERENARLLQIRQHLESLKPSLAANKPLTLSQYALLYSLFEEFKVEGMDADLAGLNALLTRVDIIPLELVLMQAAVESGWGSSRFAKEGFNLFGQWCFRSGCGLVPEARSKGRYHEVAKYTHVAESINSYFYNLNTFYQYDELRAIRAKARQQGKSVAPHELTPGLLRYSERGHRYVTEIADMIHSNRKLLEQAT